MSEETNKVCLNRERAEDVVPLLLLSFKGETKRIRPQRTLIHQVHWLADKLPGADMISAAPH